MSSLVIKDRTIVFPDKIDLSKLQDKFDLLIVISKLAGYSVDFYDYIIGADFQYLSRQDKSCRLDFSYFENSDRDFRIEFLHMGPDFDRLKISFYYDGVGYFYESNEIDEIVEKIQEIVKVRI